MVLGSLGEIATRVGVGVGVRVRVRVRKRTGDTVQADVCR